ncbi:MAG TPA: mechanosensitive ion channel protein, partial [Achromobacter sp.]
MTALLLAAMLCCLSLSWQARSAGLLPPQATATSSSALTPAALADLLENPEARKALVDELRTQAAGAKPATPRSTGTAAAPAQSAEPGLQERMADNVQRFLTGLATDMGQGVEDMRALASGDSLRMDSDAAGHALKPLALAAAATILAFILLRMIAMYIYGRIDRWVAEQRHHPETPPRRGAPASMRVLSRRAGAI